MITSLRYLKKSIPAKIWCIRSRRRSNQLRYESSSQRRHRQLGSGNQLIQQIWRTSTGCVLSLAVVTRSKIPDAREAQNSRHTSRASGAIPQALALLGRARFITWHLRRPFLGGCWWGPRIFWKCRACLGYGSSCEPTLKKLCAILFRLVGRTTNNVG